MLERWLEWARVERGLLPNTLAAYGRELRALSAFGDPVTMTAEGLSAYLASAGGKPATVGKRVAALRSFYRFLQRQGARVDDPSAGLDRPKVRKGLPRPVDDRDARLARLDPTARRVAVLLLETGLRISEACSIDVEPPAPLELVVRGKGAKERLVPLTDVARAAIDELGGHVPLSVRSIQRRFRVVGFTPHRLRHTFGCDLAEADADLGEIQDLLGHASPATTRIYARYSVDRLRRALERRRRKE